MTTILCLTPIKHIPDLWEKLSSYRFIYKPQTTYDEVLELISGIRPNFLYVNPNEMKYKLDENILQYVSSGVCTASTGINHIDVKYCEENNLEVFALTTDYDVINKISSTAEMAFALTLSLVRNIPAAFESAKRYEWKYEPFIGRQLNSLTAGIIGYGRLGKMYAHYCDSFGMKVFICDPYITNCPFPNLSLDKLLLKSDIISLHVHLNDETEGMIDNEILSYLNPAGSYLINTSRGGIVNEDDVIESLESGMLLGYATDVVADELGSIENSRIISESNNLNIIVTPHIAGMTVEAQHIAYHAAADKLIKYINSIEYIC